MFARIEASLTLAAIGKLPVSLSLQKPSAQVEKTLPVVIASRVLGCNF